MTVPQIQNYQADSPPVSVLIADDSPLMQERLKVLLETIPGICVVAQVGDVDSAETAIQQLCPAVVILDLRLPGNGLKALERIKAKPGAPVIIMFTAFSTSFHRQKCLALGADYFFDKTTDLKEFQATLKLIASQRLIAKTDNNMDSRGG
jgi:DNA-binding NarL/FixJ family response regulator